MDTAEMTDLAMLTAMVSFLMPALVAVVQQPKWSGTVRTLVAAVTSALVGIATVALQQPDLFTLETAVTAGLTIAMASMATYRAFWAPLGIERLENATSPASMRE